MYAKRISDTRIDCLTRPYLTVNGRIYTNPSEEQLRAAGYKPLKERTEGEAPSTFSVYYEEDESFVYICYREEAIR